MNDGPQEESGMHTEKALTGCMQMNRLERKSHGRHLQTSGDDGINLTKWQEKEKGQGGENHGSSSGRGRPREGI